MVGRGRRKYQLCVQLHEDECSARGTAEESAREPVRDDVTRHVKNTADNEMRLFGGPHVNEVSLALPSVFAEPNKNIGVT